jgi:hypothetical protein
LIYSQIHGGASDVRPLWRNYALLEWIAILFARGPRRHCDIWQQRRNQVYGPWFFDTDLTLMKNFRVPHWEGAEFQIGAQAFNILNHTNFDQPINNLGNGQFGQIVYTVGPPTSIFGSFLGGDPSPRALQIRAQLKF